MPSHQRIHGGTTLGGPLCSVESYEISARITQMATNESNVSMIGLQTGRTLIHKAPMQITFALLCLQMQLLTKGITQFNLKGITSK